jgi:hypothetical protein
MDPFKANPHSFCCCVCLFEMQIDRVHQMDFVSQGGQPKRVGTRTAADVDNSLRRSVKSTRDDLSRTRFFQLTVFRQPSSFAAFPVVPRYF